MTNANSRFATMRAMSEQSSFKIDTYIDWTVDWSEINGHFYSNKAPGPMLLGFPIFLAVDKIVLSFNPDSKLSPPTSSERSLLNLFIQVFPIALLSVFLMGLLKGHGRNETDILMSFILFFFGTTASLFYNSFMGHGLAAMFSFALVIFIFKKKYFLVGLFFGFTLLCDYLSGVYLIPLVFLIPLKKWKDFLLGGVFPGLLWSFYHLMVTGSLFNTVTKYMNPQFLSPGTHPLYGMLGFPDPIVAFELLFGVRRGLFFTQPWVLLIIPTAIYFLFKNKYELNERGVVKFCVFGFLLLFLVNISFNGWHGGAVSGPRYLSVGLSALCFLAYLTFPHTNKCWKITFVGLSFYTLFFRMLVFGTTILAPEEGALIGELFNHLKKYAGFKQYFRMLFFISSIAFIAFKNKALQRFINDTCKDPNTSS